MPSGRCCACPMTRYVATRGVPPGCLRKDESKRGRAYHLRRLMENGSANHHVDPATCAHARRRRRQAIEELVDSVIYIRECTECARLEIRARGGTAEEW